MSARLGQRITTGVALCALAVFVGSAWPVQAKEKPVRGKAKHVVLVVWDGMRPDFVNETNAPTLWKLAREGVNFRNHHSVYPTLTSVNATALATGVHPSRSGPIANYEYRPEIDRAKLARMDAPSTIRKGDEGSGGKYLAVPTIAELVQSGGGRTAVAGTKPAPILFDRKAAPLSKVSQRSITLFEGAALPDSARAMIEKLLGPYPARSELPSVADDAWTTRALTEGLWKDGVPDFSVLWMGEPDRSLHAAAPGSEKALAAIKSSDANLAVLLRALEQKRVRDQTDIMVVSDHGFSTIGRSIHVAGVLSKDGFTVAGNSDTTLGQGVIRVAGNGGTNLFYVSEHDAEATARLVEWLQQSDFAGVIFSRVPLEGTFPLSTVYLETAAGPDVVMSFRWIDRRNEHDVPGMIDANGKGDGARGTHGTLSRFDVHNILVAVGPDFRRDFSTDLPSSNMDIAPTIAHILGITPPHPLDGRILSEALVNGDTAPATAEAETVEASRPVKGGTWRQYLRVSKVGATVYIDEGNGAFSPE